MKKMKIDSHQHFWQTLQAPEYIWVGPEHEPIVRQFMPADLKPILEKNHIDKSVIVQAAAAENEAEFIIDLANTHDFIAGAVIWLDMESPDFESRTDYFDTYSKFLGIRPMIGAMEDDEWMLKDAVKKAFQVVVEKDICFDFLIYPRHAQAALTILQEFKGLRAVINHIGNPDIKGGGFQPWNHFMEKIASYPNVYCKLSGMVSRAEWESWKPDDFKPYIQHLINIFSPSRLMFGSDWPPCLLAGSYEDVIGMLKMNLGGLSSVEMADIFGNTACKFYRLEA